MRRARSGAGFSVGLAVTLTVLTIAGTAAAGVAASPSSPSAPAPAPVPAAEVVPVGMARGGSAPTPAPITGAIRACPTGFDVDDGRCVAQPSTTCRAGHLKDDRCVAEPAYTCPGGGLLRSTTCVTPARLVCPAGAPLTRGSCSADGRLTCPDGGDPDASVRRCTSSPRTGSAKSRDGGLPAPVPSSSSAASSASSRPSSGPPSGPPSGPSSRPSSRPSSGPPTGSYSCPKGSRLSDDGLCDWPTYYDCPDGLAAEPGSLTCTGPARSTCPANASDGSDGSDGCETTPTVTCPAGTSYAEGGCRSAPTASCEDGDLEAGRCVERPNCAPGTTVTRDGYCVREPVDPTLPCPRGTVRTGDLCSPPAPICPDGTITTPSGECVPPVACPAETAENPDGTCRPIVNGCPPDGWVLTDSGVCAPVEPVCQVGTVRDDRGLCLPKRPGCPLDTLGAPGGWCYPAPPEPVDPPQPPHRLPRDGELLLTPTLADAGDSVTASGAGCDPSVPVTITSKGEEVGRATADEAGLFTVQLRFGTFAVGPRDVTAECGQELTAQLDMVLASSTGAVGRTRVLLLFVAFLGSLAIRRQFTATDRYRPRRGRPRSVT